MPNFIGQLQGGFNALLGAAAGYKMGQDRKAHQAERERISDEFTERKLKVAESKADTAAKAQKLKEDSFAWKKERDLVKEEHDKERLDLSRRNTALAESKEADIQKSGSRGAQAARDLGTAAKLQSDAKVSDEQARAMGIENTVEEEAIKQRTQATKETYRTQKAQQKALGDSIRAQSKAQLAGATALQNLTEQTEQAEGQKQGLRQREEILNYSNREVEGYILKNIGGPALKEYKAVRNKAIADGMSPEDADDYAADLIDKKYGGKK